MTGNGCSRTLRAAVFAAVCVLLSATGHVLMSGASVPWWGIAGALALTVAAVRPFTRRERTPALVAGVSVGVQALLHLFLALTQSVRHPAPTGSAAGAVPGSGAPAPPAAGHLRHGARPPAHHGGHSQDAHHGEHAVPAVHAAPSGPGGPVPAALPADPAHPLPPAGAHGAGPGERSLAGLQDLADGFDLSQLLHLTGGTASLGMLSAHLLAALLCGLWLGHGERAFFRLARTGAVRLFRPLRYALAGAPTVTVPGPPPRPRTAPRPRRLRSLLLAHALTTRGPPPGTAVR
jgi:hypothetical protein